jgi:hypothetical protein
MFGQLQQVVNCFLAKPQLTAVLNEVEPCDVLGSIPALIACGARRRWHQANLLVVTNRRHLAVGFFRELAN